MNTEDAGDRGAQGSGPAARREAQGWSPRRTRLGRSRSLLGPALDQIALSTHSVSQWFFFTGGGVGGWGGAGMAYDGAPTLQGPQPRHSMWGPHTGPHGSAAHQDWNPISWAFPPGRTRVGGKGRNNLPSTGGLAVSASQRGRGGEERECVLTPTHCHHHICITKVGPEVPCGFVESPQPSLGDCSLAKVVPSHTATLADKSHIVGRAAAASICSPRHHPGASQLLCGANMARARDTARVRPQAQGQGRG